MVSRISRPVPVTVNDVLDGHVQLDLDCLDRLCLHGYRSTWTRPRPPGGRRSRRSGWPMRCSGC
jgi:hypothetical protein